jgi:hypothetical protein
MNKSVSCSCFSHTFKVSMLCSLIFAIFIFPKNFMSIRYVFCKKILNQLVNSVKFGLDIHSMIASSRQAYVYILC